MNVPGPGPQRPTLMGHRRTTPMVPSGTPFRWAVSHERRTGNSRMEIRMGLRMPSEV